MKYELASVFDSKVLGFFPVYGNFLCKGEPATKVAKWLNFRTAIWDYLYIWHPPFAWILFKFKALLFYICNIREPNWFTAKHAHLKCMKWYRELKKTLRCISVCYVSLFDVFFWRSLKCCAFNILNKVQKRFFVLFSVSCLGTTERREGHYKKNMIWGTGFVLPVKQNMF